MGNSNDQKSSLFRRALAGMDADKLLRLLSVLFILFWLYAIYAKVADFTRFKGEMSNQVFPVKMAVVLPYALPAIWLSIAALLAFDKTRFTGMVLNLALLMAFTIYIGLAILNVYNRMPCNCAGLLGHSASWQSNFLFNLIVTAVAGAGLILFIRDQERRNKVWIL